MKVIPTAIEDVLIIEPKVFKDARGLFFESFNQKKFSEATGLEVKFVQDNHSRSTKGVLRGLHYQVQQPPGKLVRVVRGVVFDVVVDSRKNSPTFGRWVGIELSQDNHKQIWVPPGCAHGFVVLSHSTDFVYKTTEYYAPNLERCIAWNDPEIGIKWPLTCEPIMSAKDKLGVALRDSLIEVQYGGHQGDDNNI